MVVNTYGRNIKITKGLQEAAEKEAGKFARYLGDDTEVSATLYVVKDTQGASFSVVKQGDIAYASASGSDMYAALGKAADIEERKLRKMKEKKIERHRKAKEHPLQPEDTAENYENEDDEDSPVFVDADENMPFSANDGG